MLGTSKNEGGFGKQTVEGSLHGLATVLAAIAALMASGQIWGFTHEAVYNFLLSSYGDESLANLGTLAWGALSAIGVFFICRAVFVLALMVISANVLLRLAF